MRYRRETQNDIKIQYTQTQFWPIYQLFDFLHACHQNCRSQQRDNILFCILDPVFNTSNPFPVKSEVRIKMKQDVKTETAMPTGMKEPIDEDEELNAILSSFGDMNFEPSEGRSVCEKCRRV